MLYKKPSVHPGSVCVTFELPSCVWADRISVSGSFNQWDERGLPLVQGRDGVWRATVDLAAGQRYEFRYLIDGRWQTDYHADGFTDNQYGSHNSVIDLQESGQPLYPMLSSTLSPSVLGSTEGSQNERIQSDRARLRRRVAAA